MLVMVAVALAAAIAAGLTLYSGFGLGTILMPVFALFFPLEVAVASTAVVHAANNVFKVAVVGRLADRAVVLRFGVPAICAAFIGAVLLGYLSEFDELASYSLGPVQASVTPVKLSLGLLMMSFAAFELAPSLRQLQFDRKYLPLGGILSGFFGGLSGHQGALRSAFLVKVGIGTEAFVGTNAVVGFMVDCVRIATYVGLILFSGAQSPISQQQGPLIIAGIIGAMTGILLGKKYLQKVTMATVQSLTGALLLIIATLLALGIL
jgi:uncharacterized membrane protein YfcA